MMKSKNKLNKMCDNGAYLCTRKNGSTHIVATPVTYRKLLFLASENADYIDIDAETHDTLKNNDELYINFYLLKKRDQTHYIVVASSAEEARKKINDKAKDIYTISPPTTQEIAKAQAKITAHNNGH